MKEVIKLFEQIRNTSSLNEKSEIIKKNKENKLFKKCLKFLLDNNVTTGISTAKLHKHVEPETELDPMCLSVRSSFEDVMNYLKKNNTGKDCDIYEIQCFLSGHEDDRDFYEQMITKKYRLGADAKLINKTIPGFILTFNVQLGTPIDKCKLKGDEYIYITRKLNGTRCLWVGDRFMTRQGKEYIGLDHIKADLIALGYENMFIDGELLYKNEENLTDSEAFQKGTGIAMSKDMNKMQLKFVVFDMFPLEEFWNGKSKETYSRRRLLLGGLEETIGDMVDFQDYAPSVEVVEELYNGTEHSEIWKWLDYAEQHDWEGIMINLDTPYECKRTKNLIKVKRFYTYDLRVVGVEEGTGRNKGVLGSFIVKYKENTVNVGTGFTDEQRKHFWEHRDEMIGKIIEVKYKEVTVDKKTGLESLQFPVFVSVREDKDETSYE